MVGACSPQPACATGKSRGGAGGGGSWSKRESSGRAGRAGRLEREGGGREGGRGWGGVGWGGGGNLREEREKRRRVEWASPGPRAGRAGNFVLSFFRLLLVRVSFRSRGPRGPQVLVAPLMNRPEALLTAANKLTIIML